LFLTKPLGIGILSTAEKQKKLLPEHQYIARDLMCQLNTIGLEIATIDGVKGITDVTGFGLLGHLLEMCEGSQLNAIIDYQAVPIIESAVDYLAKGCVPGGTARNFDSYGDKIATLSTEQQQLLCDPQTSGGLLIAVEPDSCAQLVRLLTANNLPFQPIGELCARQDGAFVHVQ
jgi:selenide,water dikinase